MNKLNIPKNVYNPEFPPNGTTVGNIPAAVREKGEQIINTITLLENKRVSETIEEVINIFPDVKSIFIQGNGSIADGLYNKRGDSWVGLGNFNYLPSDSSSMIEGSRFTVENRSFELVVTGENRIWVEKPYFYPKIFFDFFEANDIREEQQIPNRGNSNLNVDFILSRIYKSSEYFLPYLISSKNSTMKTSTPVELGESFTFTSTFLGISREYQDGSEEVINSQNDAVLMYIRDEYENVKIGISYDSDYRLYFFDNTTKTNIKYSVNENMPYQIGISYNKGRLRILIDGEQVFDVEKPIISNKKLYFSICNDMLFGQFANGAATVGEVQIFKEELTVDEHKWIKIKPRLWSFVNKDTYLDLSLEEKIRLKKQVELMNGSQNGSNHNHGNKSILDLITRELIDGWEKTNNAENIRFKDGETLQNKIDKGYLVSPETVEKIDYIFEHIKLAITDLNVDTDYDVPNHKIKCALDCTDGQFKLLRR